MKFSLHSRALLFGLLLTGSAACATDGAPKTTPTAVPAPVVVVVGAPEPVVVVVPGGLDGALAVGGGVEAEVHDADPVVRQLFHQLVACALVEGDVAFAARAGEQ